MKSTFHCAIDGVFEEENQLVRGFMYDNYYIEPHKHDFYEINIIISGQGTHLIEDNSFSSEKGDVFVIPPNIVHAYTNTKNMDVFHILIKPELIKYISDEKDYVKGFNILMEIEPFLRNRCEKKMFLQLSPSELSEIMNDLNFIRDDVKTSYPVCNQLKKHTVIKILYYMSNLIYSQSAKMPHDHTGYNIIRLMDYITNNYSHKITIEDLCRISNVSKSTLTRRFNEICGCSPLQYVIEYRKKIAEQMINENKLSRTQIAYECGFYDLSHMEKHLKSNT